MDDVDACLATGRSISGAVALAMLQRDRSGAGAAAVEEAVEA